MISRLHNPPDVSLERQDLLPLPMRSANINVNSMEIGLVFRPDFPISTLMGSVLRPIPLFPFLFHRDSAPALRQRICKL